MTDDQNAIDHLLADDRVISVRPLRRYGVDIGVVKFTPETRASTARRILRSVPTPGGERVMTCYVWGHDQNCWNFTVDTNANPSVFPQYR